MAIHLLSNQDKVEHNQILHWKSFLLDSAADVADLPTGPTVDYPDGVGYDSQAWYWDNGTICLYTFNGLAWVQRV